MLDWTRGAGRPEEALEAARNLGPEQLDAAERLGLWAWCEEQRGVESIEIVWPSGRVSRHRDLLTDTGYLLREGVDHPSPLKGFDKSRDDARR